MNAEDQILRAIQVVVDAALRKAPFDRTVRGRIVEQISAKAYIVQINGTEVAVPSYGTSTYSTNELVWVCYPENNYDNRFILPKEV